MKGRSMSNASRFCVHPHKLNSSKPSLVMFVMLPVSWHHICEQVKTGFEKSSQCYPAAQRPFSVDWSHPLCHVHMLSSATRLLAALLWDIVLLVGRYIWRQHRWYDASSDIVPIYIRICYSSVMGHGCVKIFAGIWRHNNALIQPKILANCSSTVHEILPHRIQVKKKKNEQKWRIAPGISYWLDWKVRIKKSFSLR